MRRTAAIAFVLLLVALPALRGEKASAEAANHWVFQPVRTVTPPTVKNPRWARSPLDRFILSKLEANQLAPSPVADPGVRPMEISDVPKSIG